jgi:hypothetical protein
MLKLIEKILDYLTGVVLALCGKYPYEELEHLDWLQTQMSVDYQWLSCTRYKPLAERHFKMIQPDFRRREFEPIQSIRERINEPMKKRDENDNW